VIEYRTTPVDNNYLTPMWKKRYIWLPKSWWIDYLLKRIKINNNCWEWQKNKNNSWYWIFGSRDQKFLVHRESYRLFKWELWDNCVLHKCDNPPCCNPKHLFLGTHQDNMTDKVNKWRTTKWAKHPQSIKVLQYNNKWKFIQEFESLRIAAEMLWLRHQCIARVCRWLSKHSWWFIFKFKDNGNRI